MKSLDSAHILARIVEAKRKRLDRSKLRIPEAIVKRMAETAPAAPSFREALRSVEGGGGKPVRLIAEIKKASPSKGILLPEFDVDALARTYAAAGASAISVVTEEDYFQGDLGWIGRVRKATPLPVLRKDFVFDPFQVYETRAAGASAILLIIALLLPAELRTLLDLAAAVKLDVLVEAHDESELDEALESGAEIIGVNNRDLKTFDVNLETSRRLSRRIPEDRIFVVESGIHGRAEIDGLMDIGADAFLVGEHLLTSGDPAAALRGLL